ncbi:MAG TPA: tRNA glutamyl-Q(34) synthetase GluQRS [Allosphingosinicella sp.]|nr:tRNA glutamyl-Q(34) synthetase GluQRS [Allosphingosinicella sp.]
MHAVTRFAPSPTGRLHLGHAYSALLAHDYARERDGTFLLRIEDIDPGRVRAEYVGGIIEDLLWLGLEWDGEMPYQSERLDIYAEALERLKAGGLLYPCFCTRADIAASVAAPQGPDPGSGSGAGGSLYPGTCRGLAGPELSRPHAWRLDVAKAAARAGPLYWMDGHTEVKAEPERSGDVVLARKDAPASYHLAVTLDDGAQGVTDVVRGRDLYAATDVHRLLQALLDLPTPHYHHHDLLIDAEGRRLAKRHGAPTLADLRAAGTDPAALVDALRRGELPAGYSLERA